MVLTSFGINKFYNFELRSILFIFKERQIFYLYNGVLFAGVTHRFNDRNDVLSNASV